MLTLNLLQLATYRFKLARTYPSAAKLFTIYLDSRMTVLDALFITNREHDRPFPSVAPAATSRR